MRHKQRIKYILSHVIVQRFLDRFSLKINKFNTLCLNIYKYPNVGVSIILKNIDSNIYLLFYMDFIHLTFLFYI